MGRKALSNKTVQKKAEEKSIRGKVWEVKGKIAKLMIPMLHKYLHSELDFRFNLDFRLEP